MSSPDGRVSRITAHFAKAAAGSTPQAVSPYPIARDLGAAEEAQMADGKVVFPSATN